MLFSMKRQFELRKKSIIISLAAVIGILLVGQVILSIFITEHNEDMLFMVTSMFSIYVYAFIRSYINFAWSPQIKNLSVGFGETRKDFAFSYYFITVAQYLLLTAGIIIVMFIGNAIWYVRFGSIARPVFGFINVGYVVIATLAPLLEMLVGGLMDTFGNKAFFIIFILFFIALPNLDKLVKEFMQLWGTDKMYIVILTVLSIYVASIIGNVLLYRKTSVK